MLIAQAKKLAAARCAELGLTAAGWRIAFDRRYRRFGVCNYRARVLSFSAVLIECNPEAVFLDTLNHEAAHALTPGVGHGQAWKVKAIELGAAPLRLAPAGSANFPFRYTAVCPTCSYVHERVAKPRTVRTCVATAACRQAAPEARRLEFRPVVQTVNAVVKPAPRPDYAPYRGPGIRAAAAKAQTLQAPATVKPADPQGFRTALLDVFTAGGF